MDLFKITILSLFTTILISFFFIAYEIDSQEQHVFAAKSNFYVSNKSDSMGLSVSYSDIIYTVPIKKAVLKEGRIYIYNKTDHFVIHRLIKCLDVDCNVSVFKGDNNKVGEFVNKSDIVHAVDYIKYR